MKSTLFDCLKLSESKKEAIAAPIVKKRKKKTTYLCFENKESFYQN